MSKRSKYTAEEKLGILLEHEKGLRTIEDTISTYKITNYTLQDWKYKYRKYGIEGLRESQTWKRYSKALKEQAVLEYLTNKNSKQEIVKKYEISSRSVLTQWINNYNSHRELKPTTKGRSHSMTKGKTTSWKERIEIVFYCIAHNNDYQHAAEIYDVSYQQVYQWVKKYELGGEDALKDRRGRKKTEEELTPEDRVNLEMKKLKAENERLRAENAFLKKLEELERGRS